MTMTQLNVSTINVEKAHILSIAFTIGSYLASIAFIVVLEINIIPVSKRGFFCSDTSIKYPYQEATISGGLLLLLNSIPSIITFVVGERFVVNDKGKSLKKDVTEQPNSPFGNHLWYIRVIKLVLMCSWSTLVTMVLTSVIKTVVGFPRPNFLEVCNPNITCASNNTNFNIDYICQGMEVHGDGNLIFTTQLKGVNQARRSFPSGHASFSAAAMTFLVLYVEKRINFSNKFVLLKPFIQILSLIHI